MKPSLSAIVFVLVALTSTLAIPVTTTVNAAAQPTLADPAIPVKQQRSFDKEGEDLFAREPEPLKLSSLLGKVGKVASVATKAMAKVEDNKAKPSQPAPIPAPIPAPKGKIGTGLAVAQMVNDIVHTAKQKRSFDDDEISL